MAKRGIQITITGKQGVGKSVFARGVLLPALRASGRPFSIVDGGEPIGSSVRTKRGSGARVDVTITNES